MSNYRNKKMQDFSAMFKALSNPNRLKIFLQLTQCCTPGTVCRHEDINVRCVGDLGSELNVAASTLSHHIKELHQAGLIKMRRNGQNVECWIEPQTLDRLSTFFATANQE